MSPQPIADSAATASSSVKERLLKRIQSREAAIGILGLGYVGLPLAMNLVEAGFKVSGFDVDPRRIESLNQGSSYVDDLASDVLQEAVKKQAFSASTDFSRLGQMDVVIVCVPTPLTRNRIPDIRSIESASRDITKCLRPGQLVVLESTTYPGTTEEVVLPMLRETALVVGEDYFLAFSPERVDPGNSRFNTRNTPKVVGGITPACGEVATALYETAIKQVVPVSSSRMAEMVKVFENTFRAVNIGLVNELALVCDKLNLNVWEVIEAAATKPFGMMKFTPGPGIGGHCIPVDPFYLTWKVKEVGFQTRFIELAGEINTTMPHFVREKVLRALGESFKSINASSILVLGVAYKPNISDWRESPAEYVMDILAQDGAILSYHDPYVDFIQDRSGRSYYNSELSDDLLDSSDCVLILTNHDCFDYEYVVRKAKIVVDTRNATNHLPSELRNKVRLL